MYIYIYICKKRVIFCMQTFQLINSDMSFVSNKACIFCFLFLLSPSSSVSLICRTKRNNVNFYAEQRLSICEPVLYCTNIVRKTSLELQIF